MGKVIFFVSTKLMSYVALDDVDGLEQEKKKVIII